MSETELLEATVVQSQREDSVKTYAVAVIGFSQTERIVLGSIFGLSARGNPRFIPFDPKERVAPDLFLVDADDPRCAAYLKTITAKKLAPVALVGAASHGDAYPQIPRPLLWTRVLKMFEEAVHQPVPSTPIQPPVAASVTAPPPARRSERVLVVDDSLLVRKFMEEKLAPYGFDVDYAESGEQAIGYTGQNRYTCVFLDVILPGVEGYQVCKLIKGKKGPDKVPAVVMLTSKSSPFDKIRGTMAGCDAYLTKPVNEEKLLEVIAKFLPTRAVSEVAL